MNVQGVLTDVAKNAVAVAVVEMVDIVNKVPVQRSEATNRLKQGATYTLARDLVDYFTTGQSDVLSMNYRSLIDQTVWNGLVGYGADKTGLTDMADRAIRDVSPLDRYLNDAIVDGGVMKLAMTLREQAILNPLVQTSALRYAISPTSLVL